MRREEQAHPVGVVLELADVGPLGEFVRAQGQQNIPVADEVAPQFLRRCVVFDQMVALLDGHHELRAEQAAGPHHPLHAGDELRERAVVVGTVMPRAARPDGVAEHPQGLGLEEVLFHDLHPVVEGFEFETVDETRRVGVFVTRKVDLAAVQGERVALYGDDAIAGGCQRQDESAVTRADDRDGRSGSGSLLNCRKELGEEGEGVFPQALRLHGGGLLEYRWREWRDRLRRARAPWC